MSLLFTSRLLTYTVRRRGCAALLALLLVIVTIAPRAHASPTPWSPPAGSAATYSWSDGRNDTGRAQNPIIADGFIFITNDFRGAVTNGDSDTAGDVIRVTLTPKPGLRISHIDADLFGDYAFLDGNGGYDSQLTLTNPATSAMVTTGLHVTDLASRPGEPLIIEHFSLDVPANFGAPIDLTFDTSVNATAGRAGAALVEMKVLHLGVETAAATAIPLPLAVTAFPGTAVLAGYFMHRMKRRV